MYKAPPWVGVPVSAGPFIVPCRGSSREKNPRLAFLRASTGIRCESRRETVLPNPQPPSGKAPGQLELTKADTDQGPNIPPSANTGSKKGTATSSMADDMGAW